MRHRRRRGERGTADRPEGCARANAGHGHAATHVAQPRGGGIEDLGGQAGTRGELAHQHEERDHRQRVVRGLEVRCRVHVAQHRIEARDPDVTYAADDQQRKPHRYAEEEQRNEDAEHQQRDGHAAHLMSRPPWVARTRQTSVSNSIDRTIGTKIHQVRISSIIDMSLNWYWLIPPSVRRQVSSAATKAKSRSLIRANARCTPEGNIVTNMSTVTFPPRR